MNPEIVLGPPGTGKTTALLDIVDEELRRGVSPDRIGFVSFTRRAAQEARTRAAARFGLKEKELRWFRTLHSLTFSALGLSSSEVLVGDKLKEWGDWIGLPVSGRRTVTDDEGSLHRLPDGDVCLHLDNLARVRGDSLRSAYEDAAAPLPWTTVEHAARGLVAWKRAKHLVDFTDMLEMFSDSDWETRLEVLLVDEAQDLSLLQWRVVERAAHGVRRIVIAGDDDQAIYRWSGAAAEHFIALPGEARVLGQSWRVPGRVQALAAELLGARVRVRRPKAWRPRQGSNGAIQRLTSPEEIVPAMGEDCLILARNSHLLNRVARSLRADGVIYELRGEPSTKPEVIEAIVAWERLRRGESVSGVAARSIYGLLESGRGYVKGNRKLLHLKDDSETTMEELRNHGGLITGPNIWHEALTGLVAEERAYLERALRRGEKPRRRPTVRLSTIHGSKGGEANHVIVLRDQARRTWDEAQRLPEDEARVFYVAATRARETLSIVAPQTRRYYDL